jgi:hypothetical protein
VTRPTTAHDDGEVVGYGEATAVRVGTRTRPPGWTRCWAKTVRAWGTGADHHRLRLHRLRHPEPTAANNRFWTLEKQTRTNEDFLKNSKRKINTNRYS